MTTMAQPKEPEPSRDGAPSAPSSRYERAWDDYSRFWDRDPFFRAYGYLGDEWGSDDWVRHCVETHVKPWITPESRALEIGPGGGRYTIRVAPLCRSLVCVDASSEMIRRSERRLAHLGHVEFVKGNGTDLSGIPGESVDFAFSFNVFVQLAIEDVYGYLEELKRVLSPDGIAVIHYASLSGDDGWKHFIARRREWSADPLQRGRFGEMTIAMMDLFADRAGLAVVKNQTMARDAVAVLSNATPAYPVRERAGGGGPTRRDFRHFDLFLDEIAGDDGHADTHEEPADAATAELVGRWVKGLGVKSAIDLGGGSGPVLDGLQDAGVEVAGLSRGDRPSEHPVVHADPHFSTLHAGSVDLLVARGVLERSPMPLLLLMEMSRITRRFAIVVVRSDGEGAADRRETWSVLSKAMWRKLFRRARFAIRAEDDAEVAPGAVAWRFLLEKA